MKNTYLLFLLFILLALAGYGCHTSTKDSRKPRVTVTLPPQKFFIEAIAGDLVDITVLIPSGSSPEEYDPSPRDVMDLEQSDLYFYLGTLPTEVQWLDAIRKFPTPPRTIDLSSHIPQAKAHDHGSHQVNVHPMGDPHYWCSIDAGDTIAKVVMESLSEEFPEYGTTFQANYTLLQEKLSELREKAHKIFDDNERAFIIYHPSLSLFSREWNLFQLVIEQNGKQPTPSRLAQLMEEAKEKNAEVVLIQREYDSGTMESIAKELSLPTRIINPSEEDWLHQMDVLLDAFDTTTK